MSDLAIHNTEDLKFVAKAMAASNYFSDAKKQSQAIAKIMFGQELNLGPAASMSNIHIIKGKPSLGSHLIAAKVKQSDKYNYKVNEKSDQKCVIDWYEQGEKVGESKFTIQQAKDIGLTRKDNWKNYPCNMLFARAISNGAKMFCPDVFITGVYTPEEMQSVSDAPEDVSEADYEVSNTEQPAEDKPSESEPDNITEEQLTRLHTLCSDKLHPEADVTGDDLRDRIRGKFGVESTAALTSEQADFIIDKLKDFPDAPEDNSRPDPTPEAQELMGKHGLTTAMINGTGKNGRIVLSDVEEFIESVKEEEQAATENQTRKMQEAK